MRARKHPRVAAPRNKGKYEFHDVSENRRSGPGRHRGVGLTMSEELKFLVDEGVATITLNRPDKLNAYTDEMLTQWLEALEACRTNPDIRFVVITGAGRSFTTGGDNVDV